MPIQFSFVRLTRTVGNSCPLQRESLARSHLYVEDTLISAHLALYRL